MAERIYDVYWQGPYRRDEWDTLTDIRHALYSIHGTHSLYGRDVLLYIGVTDGTVAQRLRQHAREWLDYELDTATVKVASIGRCEGWEGWGDSGEPYPAVSQAIARAVEALLVHAHQPAYNTQGKNDLSSNARGYRIFNTGRCGLLLPELSYLYYHGE